MPTACCVPLCSSKYQKGTESSHMFQFPREEERRRIWIENIPKDDLKVTKNTYVCAKHFIDEYIIKTDLLKRPDGSEVAVPRRWVLRKDAIPTIFSNRIECLSKNMKLRNHSVTKRTEIVQQNADINEICTIKIEPIEDVVPIKITKSPHPMTQRSEIVQQKMEISAKTAGPTENVVPMKIPKKRDKYFLI